MPTQKNSVPEDELVAGLASQSEAVLATMQENSAGSESAAVTGPVHQVAAAPRFSYALATAWALFIVGLGAAIFFYVKWQSVEAGYQVLLAEKTQLAEQYEVARAGYNALADLNAALNSAENQIIRLVGTAAFPEASTVLTWNTKTGGVKLWAQVMPFNAVDKQYQLWAIVDGKPTDAGVFDVQPDAMTMLEMKTFATVQAFAVTLEPRGGSINPTMETMLVIGEVSS